MKLYEYKTQNGKLLNFMFSASIYPTAKIKLGVILEQELSKNPYNDKLLSLVLFEMYLKACAFVGDEPQYKEADIKESLEVDEMLYIYTMVMLERSAVISKGFKRLE